MGIPSKDNGISRIESGTTLGWFVRGYKNGRIFSRLFSDRKRGGKDKALQLAREYRNKLHTELAAMPSKRTRRRRIVAGNRRNKTGLLR